MMKKIELDIKSLRKEHAGLLKGKPDNAILIYHPQIGAFVVQDGYIPSGFTALTTKHEAEERGFYEGEDDVK